MHNLNELLNRIKKRVADPERFLDAAAWVGPSRKIGPLAAPQDIEGAERMLGFSFPSVVRRMYAEIGNGSWGPFYGFYPIPTQGAKPTEDDLVGFYLECTSDEHVLEEPLVNWPRGIVMVLGRGCVDYELCDFIKPPHAVYSLSGDTWLPNTPVLDALALVADSIEDRLEQWLQS
jgi:hypothetical protein